MKRYLTASLTTLLLVMGACYRPQIGECQLRCTLQVACPLSMTCRDGFCTHGMSCKTLPDGSPPRDASSESEPALMPDGSGPEGPTSSSEIVLWLDAAKQFSFVGSLRTAEWRDQSGNGNHARQQSPASTPTYTQDAVNHLPVVTFDGKGESLFVYDSGSLHFGTSDYAVLVVGRSTSQSSDRFQVFFEKAEPFAHQGPSLFLHGSLGPPGGQAGAGDDSNSVVMSSRRYDDSQFHLFVMRRTGGALHLRIDAEAIGWIGESPTVDADGANYNATIGDSKFDFSAGERALEGDIAEIIAIRGPMGDEELLELELRLMGKYGLQPSPQ